MFSTIEAAVDYIKGKLRDFYDRQYEADSLYQQARVNLQEAYAQGKFIQQAQDSLNESIQMVNDYYSLRETLRPLANAFDVDSNLGVFPLAVTTAIWTIGGITAVILAAELLWGFYQRLDQQRVIIQQVKDGLLPAEVLTRPPAPGPIQGILNSLATLALVGGGIWFLTKAK